jgi:hypothetical protein
MSGNTLVSEETITRNYQLDVNDLYAPIAPRTVKASPHVRAPRRFALSRPLSPLVVSSFLTHKLQEPSTLVTFSSTSIESRSSSPRPLGRRQLTPHLLIRSLIRPTSLARFLAIMLILPTHSRGLSRVKTTLPFPSILKR